MDPARGYSRSISGNQKSINLCEFNPTQRYQKLIDRDYAINLQLAGNCPATRHGMCVTYNNPEEIRLNYKAMISQVIHLHTNREIFKHGGDAALVIKETKFYLAIFNVAVFYLAVIELCKIFGVIRRL